MLRVDRTEAGTVITGNRTKGTEAAEPLEDIDIRA